ncbi:MAG TPA: hypothetical protein VMI94_25105 [Bryobacteraceae bacterium]|nr:hypothetical protein [Bryobacteraceae bacterium]
MNEEGQISRDSGLYRCPICGAQVYVSAGMSFPSCLSGDHATRWILAASPIPPAQKSNVTAALRSIARSGQR